MKNIGFSTNGEGKNKILDSHWLRTLFLRISNTQCGVYEIFVPLENYFVKSILGIWNVKNSILALAIG